MSRKKKKYRPTLKTLMQSAQCIKRAVPVSVNMIVKNCARDLSRCLDSLHKGFLSADDEIVIVDTGSTDDTVTVAKAFGAKVIERPDLRRDVGKLVKEWLPDRQDLWDTADQFQSGCILNFAEARQIALDESRHDAIFWIDSDDVWEEEHPGAFRNIVDKYWESRDSFFLNYVYAFDQQDGSVTTVLKRERVVDKRNYYWAGRCHETLIPKPDAPVRGAGFWPELNAAIVHKHGRTDHRYSDVRNYCIIRNEIQDSLSSGQRPDTRSIFYMGNACRGLELHEQALSMYKQVRQLSGSRDDVYSAAYYQGLIYLNPQVKRPLDAYDQGYDCVRIKPEDPRGYFLISRACAALGRHEEGLHWFGVGRTLPEPKESLHSYDPEHIHSLPLVIAAHCAQALGREDLLDRYITELLERRPNHPEVRSCMDIARNWKAGQRILEAVQTIGQNLNIGDIKRKIKAIRQLAGQLHAVPPELEKQGIAPPEPVDERPKGNPDVAILCGHTEEAWGPRNRETGIGGSEKMVLCMAPRLQKRGARVTVYANVPIEQRGLDEFGVMWCHWAQLDEERERDTVIFWRNPAMVESPIPAKKRIVWCHDVQNPGAWTNKRCMLVDQVWVLSEFHKSTLGEAAERLGDKVVITRNGIDRTLFEGEAPERKLNRVVFCSSPDRGVITAIKAFQKAFKDDPSAELHIGYGFSPHYYKWAKDADYAHVPDLGRDVNLWDYVRNVMRACDADQRIVYHGRLSWAELADLMRSSGVWLYPTRFPEISCMAAMEAQAAGMTVVSVARFALAETIDFEYPGNYDSVIETAGECLRGVYDKEYDRAAKAKWACDRFDFEPLADEWIEKLR